MNRNALIALSTFAVALLGSGAALAQEANPDTFTHAVSSKTRVQVQQELTQARRDGSIRATSAGYFEPLVTSVPREQVRAALATAVANGDFAVYNAEARTFATPRATVASTVLAAR